MNVNPVEASKRYMPSRALGKSSQTFELGQATRESSSLTGGKTIGLFTVPTGMNTSTVYLAKYAENSTPSNPIVKVGGYEVEVNKVDPENATELEMFAYLTHMDKTYLGINHGMSSFSKMRTFADIGQQNGFFDEIKDARLAYTKERNWKAIIEKMKAFFADNPQTYKQSLDCENLLFEFTKTKK